MSFDTYRIPIKCSDTSLGCGPQCLLPRLQQQEEHHDDNGITAPMSPQPTAKASKEDNDVLQTPLLAKKEAPDVSQLRTSSQRIPQ
jgi:hypothetical protein